VVGKTWSGGFSFRPFEVKTTSREFAHSRRGMAKVHMLKPSNISVIQTLSFQETLINGIVQGWKLGSPRSASVLSRKGIAKAVGKVLARLEIPRLQKQLQNRTYSQVKASEILSARRAVKSEVISSVLVGWQKNIEDDFEVVDTLQSTS
jgi:tRNA-specific adenosine deaminase 1